MKMKTIIAVFVILLMPCYVVAQIDMEFSLADSVLIQKSIDNVKSKWHKENACIGNDSIKIILENVNIQVIPLFSLSDKFRCGNDLISFLNKDDRHPFFSIILSYKGRFIGECLYDASSNKYIVSVSSTKHDIGIHTNYYDIRDDRSIEHKEIFGVTSRYKYVRLEQHVFYAQDSVIYAIDYNDIDHRQVVLDDSFFN